MRHGKKFNHLGRKSAHRKAMLSNMACSLIEHKRITTTVAKAKELRKYVEPLINRSKEDSTHSRRVVFSYLNNKHAVTELFREVAPKVNDREGGYTRIIRTGHRLGDSAEMCMIELVDFNELYGKEEKKSRTRRSRRGGAKKKAEGAPAPEAAAEVIEDVAEEVTTEVEENVEVVEDTTTETTDTVADSAEEENNAEEDEKKD